MKIPSIDEQRKFLMLFYVMSKAKGLSSIENIINMASGPQLKEMVIDTVPEILELVTVGNAKGIVLDDILRSNSLPPFSAFIMMNSRRVSKILKYDQIENEDDAIVLGDALEAGLIKGEKRQKASLLLAGWL